jgi:hypothetical protein
MPHAGGLVETELFVQTYRSYGLATVRYPVLEIPVTARVSGLHFVPKCIKSGGGGGS